MMERSPNYIGTYYADNRHDMEEVATLRRLVKNMNKMLRESGYKEFQYRIKCQGKSQKQDVYVNRRYS